MILSRSHITVAIAFVATATACGGETPGTGGTTSATTVMATTSIWADITSNVACDAPVDSLIPAGADPHSYEPSLRDRERVENSSALIANGAGLEVTAADLLAATDVDVVEIAPHVDVISYADDEQHDDEQHDDEQHDDEQHDDEQHDDEAEHDPHGHGDDADPHLWHDPTRVAGALDVIGSALEAAGVPTCTEAYRDELHALDDEIRTLLAPIPAGDRLLVTSHDSLAYFADRYDFEIVGTVIPSTSTLADTSAGQLSELADLIEQRGARAIFTDTFESDGDAAALAGRLGIAVVPLVTGSLTDDAPTYVEMLRHNASAIATALGA